MIGVIEYGLGNIGSILNMFKKVGLSCRLVTTPDEILECDKLLLPGVGHFDRGMTELRSRGLEEAMNKAVFDNGATLLGICLGMQLLMEGSDEGDEPGLGWIKGRVHKFPSDLQEEGVRLKIPHMGWTDVEVQPNTKMFQTWEDECRFYFVHAYYAAPTDPNVVAGRSWYGMDFACAMEQGNVMGAQFHPEKSHKMGMRYLQNVFGS